MPKPIHRTAILNEFLNLLKLEEVPLSTDQERLDDMVLCSQQGDVAATELAVRHMIPFMAKYYRILKMGAITIGDKDAVRFCALFQPKEQSRAMTSTFRGRDNDYGSFTSTALSFVTSIWANVDGSDLVQALVCEMLTLIKRWKRISETHHFSGYVYNTYRFNVAKLCREQMKNPLASPFHTNVPFEDDWETADDHPYQPEPEWESTENDWIYGADCSPIFDSLSVRERAILKMKYIDNLVDKDIAEIMGVHRNTILAWRNRAEEKIRGCRQTGSETDGEAR